MEHRRRNQNRIYRDHQRMIATRVMQYHPRKYSRCIQQRHPWIEIRPGERTDSDTSQCKRKNAAQEDSAGHHVAAKIKLHRIFLQSRRLKNIDPPKLQGHNHHAREHKAVTTAKHQKPRKEEIEMLFHRKTPEMRGLPVRCVPWPNVANHQRRASDRGPHWPDPSGQHQYADKRKIRERCRLNTKQASRIEAAERDATETLLLIQQPSTDEHATQGKEQLHTEMSIESNPLV